MEDSFINQLNDTPNATVVTKTFFAENIDDLVQEFTHYLWNCGYNYVERLEIIKATRT